GAPWTRQLGQPPVAVPLAARWWRATTTIAAYRDRYSVDSAHPLGPKADSVVQRLDQQRAAAALRSIQHLAASAGPRPLVPVDRTQGSRPPGRSL
ncbi:MAG: hypothetical protein ACYCTH_13040, partial [Cellulomonas sp.]